jgi:glycosyltransferase involved in cell wall biosynthesis
LERLLAILSPEYRTLALIWDRQADYQAPPLSERLEIRRCTMRGRYYHLSTLWGVARLQPWLALAAVRARPQAVHAMDLDTGVVGLAVARALGVPFIYQCLDPYAGSLPSTWPKVIGRIVNRIENAVISRSDLFVITDLKRLPQHAGVRPRRTAELANVPMLSRQPVPQNDDTFVVGYIGSLVPHRSLDLIVDTVGALAPEGMQLVLGGFGPLSEELETRSARYPNIDFKGWVDREEILPLMASFDVFVQIEDPRHPAYRWVSPNKVFESMAVGRPIIVAGGTLAAERVRESGHGLTVTYGDAAELRATLVSLQRDAARRVTLGLAGREEYVRAWTPEIVGRRFVDAYRQVVQNSADSPRNRVRLSYRKSTTGRRWRRTGHGVQSSAEARPE